nr:MAG TPA: hypothetical protein [Caudoviricetes sp.]
MKTKYALPYQISILPLHLDVLDTSTVGVFYL